MKSRFSRIAVALVVVLSLTALLLGACAAPAPAPAPTPTPAPAPAPAPTEVEPITVWQAPASAIPWVVAKDEGYFEEQGLNIDIRVTFEHDPPFLAGQTPIVGVGTWIASEYIIEGEDVMVFGTGGGIRFFEGIAIRPEDSGKYREVQDLVGQKLGNPGFGTDVWSAFTGMAKNLWGIDTGTAFENVTASPGALLALLETGEIEGAILFSGQTVAAIASGFPFIFRFDEVWEAETGYPLLNVSNIARTSWLKENPDAARGINDALDKAVAWIAQNPEQFGTGGRYSIYAKQAGWLPDEAPEVNPLVQQWLRDGLYYTRKDLYTEAWKDSSQRFSVAVYGDEAPPKEEVFWSWQN